MLIYIFHQLLGTKLSGWMEHPPILKIYLPFTSESSQRNTWFPSVAGILLRLLKGKGNAFARNGKERRWEMVKRFISRLEICVDAGKYKSKDNRI